MNCENIGENLRTLRKSRQKISGAAVVSRLNRLGYEVSLDTYYKWERGVRQPPCDALPALARVFGVSESAIFHLQQRKNRHPDSLELLLQEEVSGLSAAGRQVFTWILALWSGRTENLLLKIGLYSLLDPSDQKLLWTLLQRLREISPERGEARQQEMEALLKKMPREQD